LKKSSQREASAFPGKVAIRIITYYPAGILIINISGYKVVYPKVSRHYKETRIEHIINTFKDWATQQESVQIKK